MTASADLDAQTENWRTTTMAAGAVLGALVGLGAAYLLIQNAEKQGGRVSINAGDGVKLSLLVMGVLRQIAALGEGK